MFNVYSDHQGHMILPAVDDLSEIADLAQASAKLGFDSLYRAFEQRPDGGEQFVQAWSVLDGVVTVRQDATIPLAHWGY